MRVSIYGLFDTRAPELIQYVGKTRCVEVRKNQHRNGNTGKRVVEWIKNLEAEGFPFGIKVLEVVSSTIGAERERFWINHWGRKNPQLLNIQGTMEHPVRTTVWLHVKTLRALSTWAKEDGRPVGLLIRQAVTNSLEKRKTK